MSLTPVEKSVIKQMLEAVARNQAAVQILVESKAASAQGRPGQAPLLCAKCRFVPDATELSKSAFCPSCLTGFVELRAESRPAPEMSPESAWRAQAWAEGPECPGVPFERWQGPQQPRTAELDRPATGIPFGKGTPRVRSVKSRFAGRIDGRRIE